MSSTDATRGQPLADRIAARRRELEAGRERLAPGDRVREDIETALNELLALMPTPIQPIPAVVAVQLSRWLELNKHLDVRPDARSDAT